MPAWRRRVGHARSLRRLCSIRLPRDRHSVACMSRARESRSPESRSPESRSHRAVGRFKVASWSETLVTDIDGEGTTAGEAYFPKRGVTRTDNAYSYTGDIEGTSEVSY